LALAATIGHLLSPQLLTPTSCILIQVLLLQPSTSIVSVVTPFVVLLDNHTTNRKVEKFMAGSGKISRTHLNLGVGIMLIILKMVTTISERSHSIFFIAELSTPPPYMPPVLTAITRRLLLVLLATSTAYILIQFLFTHLYITLVPMVTPSVVLLDNHTTTMDRK